MAAKPLFDFDDTDAMAAMGEDVQQATEFMKALAHEGRLMILCRLHQGECSVNELEALLSARQSAVSQQLSRLRLERLVKTRRDGKTMYYSIADERVDRMIKVLHDMFCAKPD
ncbi:MAG: metalloregulator ArsR/SmtB family transcription factor [Pseudomonadota bacterium]